MDHIDVYLKTVFGFIQTYIVAVGFFVCLGFSLGFFCLVFNLTLTKQNTEKGQTNMSLKI